MEIKILREVKKEELREHLYNININDENLYTEIMNPESIGIFQMNGGTAARLVNEIVPENFDELNAVNAMARPGPIENAPIYEQRKHGAISDYPEAVNEILSKTYQTCIYQEQIMEIFHKIGGFSLEEANDVRGLMKKLGKADKDPEDLKKWGKTVKKFTRGAIKQGILEKDASKIANDLVSFSSYSFNLSHSTSYTYIAIMTLYLSYYFRRYFYSAVLKYEVERGKYLFERLQSVKKQGFEILPPDINKSQEHFSPEGENKIRFGLVDIKYVGEAPTKIIMDNRPYSSVIDFVVKTRNRIVTSRAISSLISIGCFDEMETNRKKILQTFETFWKEKKSIKVEEKLKYIWQNIYKKLDQIPGLNTTKTDLRKYEKDFLGFNFFSSLFTKEKLDMFEKMAKQGLIHKDFSKVNNLSKKLPVCINSIRHHIDKNGNEMAFLVCEDMYGVQESIPVFASYYKFIKEKLLPNKLFLINVFLDTNNKALFGQKQWTNSEFKISRMLKEVS